MCVCLTVWLSYLYHYIWSGNDPFLCVCLWYTHVLGCGVDCRWHAKQNAAMAAAAVVAAAALFSVTRFVLHLIIWLELFDDSEDNLLRWHSSNYIGRSRRSAQWIVCVSSMCASFAPNHRECRSFSRLPFLCRYDECVCTVCTEGAIAGQLSVLTRSTDR